MGSDDNSHERPAIHAISVPDVNSVLSVTVQHPRAPYNSPTAGNGGIPQVPPSDSSSFHLRDFLDSGECNLTQPLLATNSQNVLSGCKQEDRDLEGRTLDDVSASSPLEGKLGNKQLATDRTADCSVATDCSGSDASGLLETVVEIYVRQSITESIPVLYCISAALTG